MCIARAPGLRRSRKLHPEVHTLDRVAQVGQVVVRVVFLRVRRGVPELGLHLRAGRAEPLLAVGGQRVPEPLEVGPLTLARSPSACTWSNGRYLTPPVFHGFCFSLGKTQEQVLSFSQSRSTSISRAGRPNGACEPSVFRSFSTLK
jgi:hypothetical protein